MPYRSRNELPKGVRDALPDHAEDIYRKAFNNAYKEHGDDATASRIAWSAVKQSYKKDTKSGWVRKKK